MERNKGLVLLVLAFFIGVSGVTFDAIYGSNPTGIPGEGQSFIAAAVTLLIITFSGSITGIVCGSLKDIPEIISNNKNMFTMILTGIILCTIGLGYYFGLPTVRIPALYCILSVWCLGIVIGILLWFLYRVNKINNKSEPVEPVHAPETF